MHYMLTAFMLVIDLLNMLIWKDGITIMLALNYSCWDLWRIKWRWNFCIKMFVALKLQIFTINLGWNKWQIDEFEV